MIKNSKDLLNAVMGFYDYLLKHNFQFNKHGFPIFSREMFLQRWPEWVIPYKNRKHWVVGDYKKTLLCFYTPDRNIYPRLEKTAEEIDEYKKYMGCIFCDLTVTWDLPPKMQEYLILVNHLHAAFLATKGIKLVANLRIGGEHSSKCLAGIPTNVMCASGFLSCKNLKTDNDLSYIRKVMQVLPSKLLIYGKKDRIVEEQLYKNGICFKRYGDYNENRRSRPAVLTSKPPEPPMLSFSDGAV